MKERNYENLSFRMMSYIDFDEFQRACLASRIELNAFLSKGKYLEYYNAVDYLNFFNAMLKDSQSNVYALFESETLIGIGITYPSSKSFGSQIVYWVRNGFHGKGYGTYLMYRLIDRTISQNGFYFAELIIDQENIASIKVAENLGLTKIKEWENKKAGQGELNSGKFAQYYAFDHWLEVMADEHKLQPIYLLDQLWILERMGEIPTPKMEIRRSTFGKTRLSQNLRFFSDECERREEA